MKMHYFSHKGGLPIGPFNVLLVLVILRIKRILVMILIVYLLKLCMKRNKSRQKTTKLAERQPN